MYGVVSAHPPPSEDIPLVCVDEGGEGCWLVRRGGGRWGPQTAAFSCAAGCVLTCRGELALHITREHILRQVGLDLPCEWQ